MNNEYTDKNNDPEEFIIAVFWEEEANVGIMQCYGVCMWVCTKILYARILLFFVLLAGAQKDENKQS